MWVWINMFRSLRKSQCSEFSTKRWQNGLQVTSCGTTSSVESHPLTQLTFHCSPGILPPSEHFVLQLSDHVIGSNYSKGDATLKGDKQRLQWFFPLPWSSSPQLFVSCILSNSPSSQHPGLWTLRLHPIRIQEIRKYGFHFLQTLAGAVNSKELNL